MSKRRNIFKDVRSDTDVTRNLLFKEAYKINNRNTCPPKEHKNNKQNPWCLHGLGQEKWFEGADTELEELHFSVRPRFLGKYSGLRNLGATCYVNSLIQVLFYNTAFRRALYQHNPSSDAGGTVISTLQQLLVSLQYSTRGVIDTTDLITSLQLPMTEQQDVVEFGELLFGLLNNSIPRIQESSRGTGSYVTKCLTCGNITTRSCDFTDLKLQVQPKNRTLVERIGYLTSVEVLEGENSYYCSVCNAKRMVERGYVFDSLPDTLQLQLLRFNYNTSTGQRTKDSSFVKFDDVLKLHNTGPCQTSRTYRLSSVIIHVGDTTQSGHYIAHVRRPLSGTGSTTWAGDRIYNWITFNDEICSESPVLDLKQYDLTSARRPACAAGEHCSQSVYMLVYQAEDVELAVPEEVSSVPTLHQSRDDDVTMVTRCSPPSELLARTLGDNEDFTALSELLQEQDREVKVGKKIKGEEMRNTCCKLNPPQKDHFIPIPTEMLKSWLETGEVVKVSDPDEKKAPLENGFSSKNDIDLIKEVKPSILCVHKKLSYHKLTEIKYINKDLYTDKLFVCNGPKNEVSCNGPSIDPCGTPSSFNWPSIDFCSTPSSTHCNGEGPGMFDLCRDCVEDDLIQHLADQQLDQDYKAMVELQGLEADTGWWVCKTDFKNFKKIVKQGQTSDFNSEVVCSQHSSLEPDLKKRKLVSNDIISLVKKHIAEFPILKHDSVPCSVCSEESSLEKIYFSQLLSMRRDLNRLLTDSAFPFIPSLTPYIVPIKFIRSDLQLLYKQKLQIRITLDNKQLLCKHSLLASDALEHAAFVKESEWSLISAHFGPTTVALRCDTLETGALYDPGICSECVMQHDAYHDQMIYLREDRAPGKRGRRGDKIIYVSSDETVHDVKVKICRKIAVAPSEQTLSTLSGRVLEYGTMQEHGVLPGSILYLDYTHAVCEENEIFDTVIEQGFKGTVLSQL